MNMENRACQIAIIALALGSTWAAGGLEDANTKIPTAPASSIDNREYRKAVWDGDENILLYKDRYQGRRVSLDAGISMVQETDAKIVVYMDLRNEGFRSLLGPWGGPVPSCEFDRGGTTAPLSSWKSGQAIWVTGTMGKQPRVIDACVLSAYVDPSGKPTSGGSRHLDGTQTFPPPRP